MMRHPEPEWTMRFQTDVPLDVRGGVCTAGYLPTEKTVCSPGRCLERGVRLWRRPFLDRTWAHRWQELWSLPEWTVW